MVESMRTAGVPTVVLVHGLLMNVRQYLPVLTDFIATMGEADRETLIQTRLTPQAVRSVGCPRFDSAGGAAQTAADADRAGAKTLVLLASQANSAGVQRVSGLVPTRRLLRAVYDGLSRDPAMQLVMRLHPADDMADCERMAWEQRGVMFADGALYGWLRKVDVVVTQASTVGLEALFVQKPLVIVNLTGEDDLIPFVKEGVAVGVSRAEDILPAVRNAFGHVSRSEAARRRFVEMYAGAVDGRSAERVASFVAEIATQGTVRSISEREDQYAAWRPREGSVECLSEVRT